MKECSNCKETKEVSEFGIKKSQKGRVSVWKNGDSYKVIDGLGLKDNDPNDQLEVVFKDGKLVKETTFAEIRARLLK